MAHLNRKCIIIFSCLQIVFCLLLTVYIHQRHATRYRRLLDDFSEWYPRFQRLPDVPRLPPIAADPLWSRVRIFCWILTSPKNHARKAVHVKATWARRCNGYAFMSSMADPRLPAIDLHVAEGHNNLWLKTVSALRHIRRNHLADYDFFLKADDDTYIVMENLRRFLANADPDAPLFAGRRFRPWVRQGYMSGGAGYVLSRAAVLRFVDLALPSGDEACSGRNVAEDICLASCLHLVGVKVLDSLDSQGRERFHPLPPEDLVMAGGLPKSHWLWHYGPDCCSDASISFHYVTPRQMYVLELLINQMKPPVVSETQIRPPGTTNATNATKASNTSTSQLSNLSVN